MADKIGEITILHGTATAEGPDGVRELSVGSPIYNDDVVSSGAKSALEIEFKDGAVLSQGANSKVHLDDYVFDPENDAGEMTMELIEGTFRSVTGKIVDMNPEGFKIDTPNTTIGIRGTTTGHEVPRGGGPEIHAVIDFDNKPVVLESRFDGSLQIIARDGFMVTSSATGMGMVQQAPQSVLNTFGQLSSQSLQQQPPEDQGEQGDQGDAGDGGETGEGEGAVEGVMGDESGGEFAMPGDMPDGIAGLGMQIDPILPTDELPRIGSGLQNNLLGPAEDDFIDDIQETYETTLNKSDFGQDLTVYLGDGSPGSYWATGTPTETWSVAASIVNVVGDLTHVNNLNGNDADNILSGGAADDVLKGDDGNDTLIGGYGDNDLQGGNGFDWVDFRGQGSGMTNSSTSWTSASFANGKTDTLDSIEGMIATNFNDNMSDHSSSSNWVKLLDGNDVISMYGGQDTIEGGAGDDTMSFYSSTTAGSVLDGGSGTDELITGSNVVDLDMRGSTVTNFEVINSGNIIRFYTSQADTSWTLKNTIDTGDSVRFTMDGSGNTDFDASTFTLDSTWTAGNNEVHITGNAGANKITGTAGKDVIDGLGGNDWLFGGQGADTLTGGNCSDVFRYNDTGEGLDTITDFSHTDDSFSFDSCNFGCYTGTLDSGHFFTSAGAVTGTDACFYTDGGTLYFDDDGIGTNTAVAIADFSASGDSVDHTDITFS